MNFIKSKKFCAIVLVLLIIIIVSISIWIYNSNNKAKEKENLIGFSFGDGYNITIGLDQKENNEFKIDVTDKHVHVNGTGSIVKRIYNYFVPDSEENTNNNK